MKLDWSEIIHAAQAGLMRSVRSIKDGRALEAGRNGQRFEQDIIGAIGEYAVAKALGINWHPAVGFLDTNRGDVGRVQVKSTVRRDGCLIVRAHDDADFPFVLATIDLPEVNIVGWIEGKDAKNDCHWRGEDRARGIHQAAFFVKQEFLRPIAELRATVTNGT